jgi:hypothetical protein
MSGRRILGALLITLAVSFATAPVVHALHDEDAALLEEADAQEEEVAYYDEAADLLDEVVETSPEAQPCPAGTEQLFYRGEPVVLDSAGTPVCVYPQPNGQAGETVPGENGEPGGASDSEGVVDPGGAGEIVNPGG